jgi:hypothetical protein
MTRIEQGATRPEWIVCLGTDHDVAADGVRCPLAGGPVSVTECLECRHLGSFSDERDSTDPCTTEDFVERP